MTRLLLIFFAVLLPTLAFAKRGAPPKVEPLVYQGIRYIAPNDDGRRAYVEAWDEGTNQKLWVLTVFTNRIDPKLEADVQHIFIKTLKLRDGKLIIVSEREETYRIDLATRAVTQSELNPSVEATADSAFSLPLEFLVRVSHSSAVPHASRSP